MHRCHRSALLIFSGLFGAFNGAAQLQPDERVDVTGDGIPDLFISGHTKHWEELEWGKGGLHERWLAPLPGVSFLTTCTPNNSDYYRLEEGRPLTPEGIEDGLRFLHLCWTRPEDSVRIGLLSKGFGFHGVDTTNWYGSDLFEDGTLVIRSTTGTQPTLTAFTIDLDVTKDKVGFTQKASIPVDADFGEFTPILEPFTHEDSAYASIFDRELFREPIVPAGIPPDERIDLVSNDTLDVVLTGHIAYKDSSHKSGWYKRGISPLPGTDFLLQRRTDGSYEPFRLKFGEVLASTRLEMDLHSGHLRWASPERESVFILALEQAFAPAAGEVEVEGWYPVGDYGEDDLVFRSNEFGRPMLGTFEIRASSTGRLWIDQQELVDAGKELHSR